MNLADNIVRALRNQTMTLEALYQAMNDASEYDWSEEFFAERVAQLLLIGRIVKDGDKYAVPWSAQGA